ncbi:MAG: adenylate/guanylate cyclase domain-containing protein [Chloroflexota bacterium]|nr:MAG: adenylate/guanylate cyclase domain-containing protein [Chloroflexota bacterium]
MIDDAHTDAGAAAYRGFLFSDMRGFTAFAERYGNSAAASMVNRFLEIARTAIAHHQGAEIKTEGDAIHAVFPSASGAVLCGLEIVDAAAELNAREPEDRQLGLGVGVHAGEAVETAEGYIGRAVNIAARLCAVARPGEVLVSSTVKGITQSSIPVGFIPRGRRRLKGIHDPILVYAVSHDTAAKAPRQVPRFLVLGAGGAALVIVVAIGLVAGWQYLTNPAASPPPTDAPAAQPVTIGPLPIGTYTSQGFQPGLAFDIVDQGWTANRDQAEIFGLIREGGSHGSLLFMRVAEVIENPCVEGGEGAQTGLGAADLVTELERLEHLVLANHEPVQVGGFTGQQVDVTVSDGVLAACGGLAGSDAALFRAGEEVWSASPSERFRLISVDVDGQALTIVVSTDWTQVRSVRELEDLLALSERVLDSVEF